MPDTLAWPLLGLGDACQSGKMATLLNAVFVMLKKNCLPNYRVKYYAYILKRCSGVACNCCVSLDIAFILVFF